MSRAWAVPSQGEASALPCPACQDPEGLEFTPIHLLTPTAVVVVGGWTLCSACGHSLHSAAPPEGFDPDAQATTGHARFFPCPTCWDQDLRIVPITLSTSTGAPRRVGEWGVCLSCGASPYTNSEEEP